MPSFASSLLATAGCHLARLLNPPIASHTVRAGTGRVVDMLTLAMVGSSVASNDAAGQQAQNRQRVAALTKRFSCIPNATRGRTA